MNQQQLKQYLNQALPNSLDAKVELSADGTLIAVCTEYKDGELHRQFIEAGWQNRRDAFVYAVGMLRYIGQHHMRQPEHDQQ